MNHSKQDIDLLATRVNELRLVVQKLMPENIANQSGSEYLHEEGEIHLSFWDSALYVALDGYVVRNSDGNELPSFLQTLVLYYLSIADGTLPSGRWISFAELPNGRMYDRAFQGYTGNELVKIFGLDVDSLKTACVASEGANVEVGGEAYVFWAFPRVPILVNYWVGDDEFPSSCKLLFDDSVSHYLPIDACAILGSSLTRKIASMA